MNLDHRLAALASLVPAGAKVADVGTDHAYLAVELQRRGAALVIASDKNEGPCYAAKETIAAAGLTGKISVRQGDGLAVLAAGEVDTLCIAGMGGKLIADILAAAPGVTAACSRLVLQPMNDAEALRRWLQGNGWTITREVLAEAAGQLYVVLLAGPGTEVYADELHYLVGPRLVEERPELFEAHVQGLIAQAQRAVEGMARSEAARQSSRYGQLLEKISRLQEVLSC